MMEHAESKFSNPALFMKCDDDTFVNTKLLKQEIRGKRYKNPLIYWGYFNGNAPIFKKVKPLNSYFLNDEVRVGCPEFDTVPLKVKRKFFTTAFLFLC